MENRIHNQWWTTQTIWWSTKQTILTKHTKRVRRIQIIFVHFVNYKQWRKWTFILFLLQMKLSVSRLLLFDRDNSSKIIMSPLWLHQWYNYDHYFIVSGTSTRSLVTCGTYYSLFHFSMSEFDYSFVLIWCSINAESWQAVKSSRIVSFNKACPAPPSISITYALQSTWYTSTKL